MEQLFFPLHVSDLFSHYCLFLPFHHFQIIFHVHCLATMNNANTIKKHSQHYFHIGLNLPAVLGLGDVFVTDYKGRAFVSTS